MITAYLSATEQFVPRLGSLTLETGSLVMAMSDGVSDLIPLDGLAAQRDTYLQIANTRGVGFIVDQILDSIESARDEETDALLHSDNMTLGMAVTEQEGRSFRRRQ